jgi:hypothetical protein
LAPSVASGVALALSASEMTEPRDEPCGERPRAGTWGVLIALVAALLQLPVGMWLLAALPGDDQSQLLGNDLWATGLLAAGFFVAISLMHELASLAFGAWTRTSVRRCAMKMCVVTVAMAGASLRLGM